MDEIIPEQSLAKKTDKDQTPRYNRIVGVSHGLYSVYTEKGTNLYRLSGLLHRRIESHERRYPALGDFAILDEEKELITDILPENNRFSRARPGREFEDQLFAVNLDRLFITMGLDSDYKEGRLERYTQVARLNNLNYSIILTKKDLCEDPDAYVASVKFLAPGAPVFCTDALHRDGIENILAEIPYDGFIYLAGSSGAGKSTLINALFGSEVRATAAVRETDGRGRHTTSDRIALRHPDGFWVADSPGLREIGLPGGTETEEIFSELCRFSDCTHRTEPGCAVLAALEENRLTSEQYLRILELDEESQNRRVNAKEARRQRDKTVTKQRKQIRTTIKRKMI
jgi:ribosome biogenesis GTPase